MEITPPGAAPSVSARLARVAPPAGAAGWQTILAASFLPLWIGFALLPETQLVIRAPLALLLVLLAGAGTELASGLVPSGRMGTRSLWVVPAGAVLAVIWLLCAAHGRPPLVAPLAALGVVVLIGLQRAEVAATNTVGAAAHALNIGLVFALTLGAYVAAVAAGGPWGVLVVALASGPAVLVVVRGLTGPSATVAALVGSGVLLLTEAAAVLLAGMRPPLTSALVLLLGLYVVSSVCHALLDRAPRRAYVEIGLVALLATAIVGAVVARA